jgi:hypothetical protein
MRGIGARVHGCPVAGRYGSRAAGLVKAGAEALWASFGGTRMPWWQS